MEEDKCVIAITEALSEAIRVALEEVEGSICTPEAFDRALANLLSKMLGIEHNPTKCDEILAQPPSANTCKDFYEQRRWVMCRAHQLLKEMKKEGKVANIGEAINTAWSELREKCLAIGHVI
ncbi:MAG: hypothetical protein QXV75_07145 [Candidatus Bathyarchaeia archaeon]